LYVFMFAPDTILGVFEVTQHVSVASCRPRFPYSGLVCYGTLYLFIYGLFNDDGTSSGYTVPNGKMRNELEKSEQILSWLNFPYCPAISLY
jgi:hypothetical protein